MAETNEGCPRLKMGYESCDAPLCDCPRAKETMAMSKMRKLRYSGTDWRSVTVLEECERGHEFVKLPDHPLNGLGHAACPHCMAVRTLSISLDQDREQENERLRAALEDAKPYVEKCADGDCPSSAIGDAQDLLAHIAAILALREGVEEVP